MHRGSESHEIEAKGTRDRFRDLQPSRDASNAAGHWTPPAQRPAGWPSGEIAGHASDQHIRHARQERQGSPDYRDSHAWFLVDRTMPHPDSHAHVNATIDFPPTTNKPTPSWQNAHSPSWRAAHGMTESWPRTRSESFEYVEHNHLRPALWHPPPHPTRSCIEFARRASPGSERQQQDVDSPSAYSWSAVAHQHVQTGRTDVEMTRMRSDRCDEQDDTEECKSEAVALVASVRKGSRYLREMDRRIILDRLAHGEKQATLAKEFNVSRAAICNLFKHRGKVLARANENPFAKHPKKRKQSTPTRLLVPPHKRGRTQSDSDSLLPSRSPSTGTTSLSGSTVTSQPSRSGESGLTSSRSPAGTLHVMKTTALRLLISAMSDRDRSLEDFRRNSERVLWLVLEEALALVPVKEIARETEYASVSYEAESPACAISMEPNTLNATPMLDIFQLMEPYQPVVIASVLTTLDRDGLTVEIAEDGLPPTLRGYNVFVLDVVAASGEAVCLTIERLVRQFEVAEASVTVVSLFASSEVVAMAQCKYPLAKIVTTRIDSSITRRRIASTPVDLILDRMRQGYAAGYAATSRR